MMFPWFVIAPRYCRCCRAQAEYGHDHDDAVVLLCEIRAWSDAIRMAYSSKRTDLLETVRHASHCCVLYVVVCRRCSPL